MERWLCDSRLRLEPKTSSTVNIKGVKGSEYFRINRSILLVTAWSSLWFIDPYFRPCEVKPSPIHRLSLRIIISSWEQTFIKNYRTILIKTTLDKSSCYIKCVFSCPNGHIDRKILHLGVRAQILISFVNRESVPYIQGS